MLRNSGDRLKAGLTDGISSRYRISTSRSHLLPSLDMMKTQTERHQALHGRLEELLVFEITKEGGTELHRFTVRTLHKYVLNSIKTALIKGAKGYDATTRRSSLKVGMLDHHSLGRTADQEETHNNTIRTPPGPASLGRIDEQIPSLGLTNNSSINQEESKEPTVTYRERLGGFLHPRDMRKLVTPFSATNEPELIVRRHAMLLNFDPLRAIILQDRLLVLVPDGADSILVQLENLVRGSTNSSLVHGGDSNGSLAETAKMQSSVSGSTETTGIASTPVNNLSDSANGVLEGQTNLDVSADENSMNLSGFLDNEWQELEGKDWIDLPFELLSVDAVLQSVCGILAEDVSDLNKDADKLISELVNPGADVGDHAQEILRTMKNSVKEMASRVNGFCRAIDLILEDYEDMALMNLSRLCTHPERFVQPVPQAVLDEESDEPELILEAHLQRGHTLTNALALVQGQIHSTEEFAIGKSDTIRNRLLYINMVISIISLSVALGSLVGSLFGMNVINSYEDSLSAFRVIVFSTIAGSAFFILFILFLIRLVGALPNLF